MPKKITWLYVLLSYHHLGKIVHNIKSFHVYIYIGLLGASMFSDVFFDRQHIQQHAGNQRR